MCETLLTALDLNPEDKIIAIRENKLADATFILASLMSKCISENKNICLVTLHNTFTHYQNIGRRLGFDLSKQMLIDPLNDIAHDLITPDNTPKKYYSVIPELIAKRLLNEIFSKINDDTHCCVIIDDLSHLLDLGLDLKLMSSFVRHLLDLTIRKNVSLVVNCHATCPVGDILANLVFYSADLMVVVSSLKTGRSRSVSGVLNVKRNSQYETEKCCTYHYKLTEKDVRVFAPGRAIM